MIKETNIVAEQLDNSKKRVSVFQGGARSGKTYNILIWLIQAAINVSIEENRQIYVTICRATLPALKASVFRDFMEIMYSINYHRPQFLNKSEMTYTFPSGKYQVVFEFISIDQPDKIRGRKRDYLFINEANEIDYDSWMQLIMRTTVKAILDYNPSMEYHWIYDEVIPREDADFYKSTYKDNKFLEPSVIAEIERLQSVDENYWKIYGLGERGTLEGLVFSNWKTIEKMPDGDKFYGLDFGYTNHPTALVEVININDDIFIRELIYSRGLTNQDIASRFLELGIDGMIVADSAEPKSIDELCEEGFDVVGAAKGQDSIRNGIDLLKQYNLYVTSDSVNLIKELRNYKWEKHKNSKDYTNKPVDAFNHGIDALRYACQEKIRNYELIMF